jgi:hypothetical protein
VNEFSGLVFSRPLALVTPPGGASRLFVVEQPGTIFMITNLAPPDMLVFPSRNDAARFVGEHGHPGCGSVRPRTGPGRTYQTPSSQRGASARVGHTVSVHRAQTGALLQSNRRFRLKTFALVLNL